MSLGILQIASGYEDLLTKLQGMSTHIFVVWFERERGREGKEREREKEREGERHREGETEREGRDRERQ